MPTKPTLTVERLREVLDYDPDTGVFRWKIRVAIKIRIGDVAGTPLCSGYWAIKIDGKSYRAHRLGWAHFYGTWPEHGVDHINRCKLDNRITNLRPATQAQNAQNIQGPKSNNKSGLLGVYPKKNRWAACIGLNGESKHLGSFSTPEEAGAAYETAKRNLHLFYAEGATSFAS